MNKLIVASLVVIAFMSAMLVHGLVILPEMRRGKVPPKPTYEERMKAKDEEFRQQLEYERKLIEEHRSSSEDD